MEIAIQVDVFLCDAAHMREAMGVEGVDVHHRHTTLCHRLVPFSTAQGVNLDATAAITFNAVTGTADQQDLFGIGRTFAHHVHGQLFAISAFFGVDVRFNLQACLLCSA